jgi:bifunctional DNA-binding transcriptional regulator/antitoxin component of YhaV-PrlF toxin-antitoxin module
VEVSFRHDVFRQNGGIRQGLDSRAVRRLLGLRPGEDVIFSLAGETIRIEGTRASVLRRLREEARQFALGRVLSEELIAERRAEAEREG